MEMKSPIDSFNKTRDQIVKEVDQYLGVLSAKYAGSLDVLDFVTNLSEMLESMIASYTSGETKFGKTPEDDFLFFQSVERISTLADGLSEFTTDMSSSAINRTSVALQRAMAFLEEEFRALLEPQVNCSHNNLHKFSSFNSNNSDNVNHDENYSMDHQEATYPDYSPDDVARMHEMANAMISCGYEMECWQVYYLARRTAIRSRMTVLNMDDVVRMPWESLESEITRWIGLVRTWSEVIHPGETRLGQSVFSDHPHVHASLLAGIVRTVVIQLLDFAEATAMARRSAEKLFKYLDMYEALQGLVLLLDRELVDEVSAAAKRICESAAGIFCDLETSIRGDAVRTPVPGGAVHPLTRYVINYLKYACEYRDTLEKVFAAEQLQEKSDTDAHISNNDHHEVDAEREMEEVVPTTPFVVQVVKLMDLLDDNLEHKSRLYKDPSLSYIFLMNNGRYILQKVKGSAEIQQVMGDTWCRRRSTVVRAYHKSYQRETWNRVLQCLTHDGLLTNGKPNKPLIKERFKIFTAIFDEIHRVQSTWVISDQQLQSELRISISSVVIPAYRSFVGHFQQYLISGKQADKYIKYQPEDIEGMIEGLFEGNTTSMGRRRT